MLDLSKALRAPILELPQLDYAEVVITPSYVATRFALRLNPDLAKEAGTIARFWLGGVTNSAHVSGTRLAARIGPDEWLLISSDESSDSIGREIETALSGRFYSLVDISHRNVGIEVTGERAPEALNGGVALDLSDTVFPGGCATRTLLGKAEIILIRPGAERLYRIECWRSFGRYVHEFLSEAAREFAVPKETSFKEKWKDDAPFASVSAA